MLDPRIEEFRRLSGEPVFRATYSQLHKQIVPTRQLLAISAEMTKLQDQVAEAHTSGFWAEGNRQPVKGLIVVGPSRSGKTFALKTARAGLADVKTENSFIRSNSIYIETPENGTVGSLAKRLILEADGVAFREPKDHDAPRKMASALERHRFTTVVIDEASFLLTPQRHSGRGMIVQSQLFWAMAMQVVDNSTWPTPLVIGGLRSVIDTLNIRDKKDGDTRLRLEAKERFTILDLGFASAEIDGPLLMGAIAQYCNIAQVESILTDQDLIIQRLLHASSGSIGIALESIQNAVAMAKARPRGKLKREDFAVTYELKGSDAREANPFRVTDFERIDMRVVAAGSGNEARLKEEAVK